MRSNLLQLLRRARHWRSQWHEGVQSREASPFAPKNIRTRRRGAIALLFMVFMVVCVLVAALAINWSYLVTVQNHLRHVGDAMALAGAALLPDDGLLRDLPADQTDDRAAAAAEVNRLLQANLRGTSKPLAIHEDDVTITPGRVPNIAARLANRQFVEAPPYNALRVDILRRHDGAHPVMHLMSGIAGADPVDVPASSIAAIDDQLVGFRPTARTNAPLLPLAISEAAWSARSDTDANGIREAVFRLRTSDPASAAGANGAVVDLAGVAVDWSRVHEQLDGGVRRDHLTDSQIGPAGPGGASQPAPLSLPAVMQTPSDAETQALVQKLNTIAASSEPRRAIPVFRTISADKAEVIGFVAARLLGAESESQGAGASPRLKVVLEPCYLIHTTAWTDPASALRNPYIFKLRLLQ